MLKTKSFFFMLMMVSLTACSEQKPAKDNTQTTAKTDTAAQIVAPPLVGGDSDEHGCKGSAGYTWSVVKNECIRVFESGIRLDAQAAIADKTTSTFVVFKSETDDAQAELFLPSQKETILLEKDKKNGAGLWKNKAYKLTQWKGMYTLENDVKVILYQGAAAK